jgi:predicted DNA-binding protein (MmcQ/YjbR family)
MNIELLREYCINKKGVTEEFPFDETTLVFKVMGKIFALTDLIENMSVNLKCDPILVIKLREQYPETVLPGYHMNKKHWNTVKFDDRIKDTKILEWIDNSYKLVVVKLTKKDKEILKNCKKEI